MHLQGLSHATIPACLSSRNRFTGRRKSDLLTENDNTHLGTEAEGSSDGIQCGEAVESGIFGAIIAALLTSRI